VHLQSRWVVPYRIDLTAMSERTLDRLIDLGAVDVEVHEDGAAAVLMPDSVTRQQVTDVLGASLVAVSPAVGRDAESVWVLSPRSTRIGRVRIVPAHLAAEPGTIRLIDAPAFGTGLHPTTALCIEALGELVDGTPPDAVLDVGTGSGVLALTALTLGVPRALGIDIDEEALRTTAENARLNGFAERLDLMHGGPEIVTGRWPLVLANVLAAPLIEMAPSLVQRIGHHGRLVLSGIPTSVEPDVEKAYRRLGMNRLDLKSRGGWVALVMQATW
jgi:ribosomal protein L11 methyltransferase